MNEGMEFQRPNQGALPTRKAKRTQAAACSVEDMERILQEVVSVRLDRTIPLSELVEEEAVEKRGSRVIGSKPLFELRFRASKFNEQGIVGHISRLGFERKVKEELQRHLESLRAEQPACDWRLVAAIIESTDLQKTVPVAALSEDGSLKVDSEKFSPTLDVRQLREDRVNKLQSWVGGYQERPQIVWRLRCAYADISQADIVDPNFRVRGQKPDPAFTQYVEKRQTRYMPPGMLKNRMSALKVIRLFEAAPVVVVRTSAARSVPRVEQLTEEQLLAALAARDEGTPTALIAQLLGVPAPQLDRFEDKLVALRRKADAQARAETEDSPPGDAPAPPANPPVRVRKKPENQKG